MGVMVVPPGSLLAHVPLVSVPVVGFIAANVRGLLAVAIACCVPFGELSGKPPYPPRSRRPGRPAARRWPAMTTSDA